MPTQREIDAIASTHSFLPPASAAPPASWPSIQPRPTQSDTFCRFSRLSPHPHPEPRTQPTAQPPSVHPTQSDTFRHFLPLFTVQVAPRRVVPASRPLLPPAPAA